MAVDAPLHGKVASEMFGGLSGLDRNHLVCGGTGSILSAVCNNDIHFTTAGTIN